MALLNTVYLKAIASIEVANGKRFDTIATGFLIGFLKRRNKDPQKRLYSLFLVTNRHVFKGKEDIFLRFNKKGGSIRRFKVPLKRDGALTWLEHRNSKVDLAMLAIAPKTLEENEVEWIFLNEETFADVKNFEKIGIELGDNIYAVGFPLGLSGKLQNFPVVKAGVIARNDKEILRSGKSFLIDTSIFPGNSGGPVFLKPETQSLEGTKSVNFPYLLGIISGHLPYKEILYSHQSEPYQYAGVSVENSGLASVVPIDYARQIYKSWLRSTRKLEKAQKGAAPGIGQPT